MLKKIINIFLIVALIGSVYCPLQGCAEYTNDIINVYEGESILDAVITAYTMKVPLIVVHEGHYDIMQEYRDTFGIDYFETYKGDDDGVRYNNNINGNFDYGIWVDNLTIIFESNTYVSAIYEKENNPDYNKWVTRYFSAFATGSHAEIIGLNIEAANLRYAIHPDYHTDAYNECQIFKNCTFLNDSPDRDYTAFGCGLGKGGTMILENCIFKYPEELEEIHSTLLMHNNRWDNAQMEIVFNNCTFCGEGYAEFSHHGESTLITTITMNGCTWKNAPTLNFATKDFNIENIELIFNNCSSN